MDNFALILITLLLSAFFSGIEIAFVSANRLRLEIDKKRSNLASRVIKVFSDNQSQFITTMLIGNNIALVVYGIIMAKVLEPVIEQVFYSPAVVLLLQTIISTAIILLVAEFLPKTLFRINPNKSLKALSGIAFIFYVLFYPVATATTFLSKKIIEIIFRIKMQEESDTAFGKTDLGHLVNEMQMDQPSGGELKHDVKILQNALDFSNIKIRECVVPRPEIVAVSITDSVESIKKKFIETGLSKILVYQNSIDNIVGFAPSITLFKKPKSIASMVLHIPIVPETMPANKLLKLFIQNKKSIALVVDEFGGTSGIVTIEDIIEEIIGDIQDEHDKIKLDEKQISENEFRLSGRLEIDYLNEKFDLGLPVSDEYETIAGMILTYHGSFPKINDIIIIGKFTIKILKAGNTKIESVYLTKDK